VIAALAVFLVADGGALVRAEKKNLASFGALEPPDARTVQAEAQAWATQANLSADKKKQFAAIWAAKDLSLSDRVLDTLLLDEGASKVMAGARDPLTPAPTAVPEVLKDAKKPAFYRANLAVAYAKALSNRRIYEEALATLKTVKPEDVVDPAVYLFHRAVAEHAMLLKEDAHRSIVRLLDDVADVPERYKAVGALMLLDMLTWREKDLNWIARKMDNSGRRLQLARGGPVTQKIQKDIVRRLDELIKEMENQAKGKGT
jgi:hypothetical protein